MPNFNQATLAGNITRAIETKPVNNGQSLVGKFGLAVNSKFGEREEVLFIDITVWDRTAEIVEEYTAQGDPLLVSGRLVLDQWEDKETGEKKSRMYLVADKVQLLKSKPQGAGKSREETQSQSGAAPGKYANRGKIAGDPHRGTGRPNRPPLPPVTEQPDDDDIPF